MIELLKLTIRAVLIERDEDGKIIGETLTEPAVIYAPEHFEEFVEALQKQINEANQHTLALKEDASNN
jgi:hypothetical protein